MKIAATYDNGVIFQHFGKSQLFKVYTADDDNNITAFEIVSSDGQGHGALADVLARYGVDALVCGGIGDGAVNALESKGIDVYAGNAGDPDRAVIALLAGKLPKRAANCDHHHHGPGHSCGDHGCH